MTLVSAPPLLSKRQVIRSCKSRGWTVQPAALQGLLHETEDSLPELLDRIADKIAKAGGGGRTVTADIWQQILDEEEEEEEAHTRKKKKQRSTTTAATQVEVVSAFETPKLVYQVMRKQFQVQDPLQNDWSLWGSAQDKTSMLAERYALLHQRVLRHDLFRPNDLHGSTATGQHQLTPVESLLGNSSSGSKGQQRLILVLGLLLQLQEGVYYLEDPTGQVPVNLSNAVITDGSFVTEHSILLAEGHFQDGVLVVHRLGQPLPETRADSLAAIQQQVSHPYYSTIRTITKNKKLSSSVGETQQSFVILSDVQADHPRVMQRLEAILARYEKRVSADDNSDDALPLFVLMGPFSCMGSSQQQQQSGADDLVALVARLFPRLAQTAHFCLVPSHDVMGVLPFAPPKKHSSHKLRHCHWASNPCRLRWAGREMVIFRYDLLPLLQQHSMGLPGIVDTEEEDAETSEKHPPSPYKRLIRTVLDQSCLVPVAGTPVYWNYHHALSLYPLPDCLVLTNNGSGGGSQQHYTERYLDCRVIVAGSLMAPTGTYTVFRQDRGGEDDEKVDRFGMDSDNDDNEKQMAGSSAGVKFISLEYLSKKETKSRK